MDDVTRLLLSAAERHLPEGYKIVPATTPSPTHAGVLEALKNARKAVSFYNVRRPGSYAILLAEIDAALTATERQPEKVELIPDPVVRACGCPECEASHAPEQKPDGVTDMHEAMKDCYCFGAEVCKRLPCTCAQQLALAAKEKE